MIVARLASIVGSRNLHTGAHELEPYLADSMVASEGRVLCVARPGSTAEVAKLVRACAELRVALIPRGGGTGFAGGALPRRGEAAVLISLDRMRAIRSLDPVGDVLIAEAGCTLYEVRQAAAGAGRLIGLDHGGAGSSQLGGNLATNAGGNNVLRYGMAREQVLGLEAVLADGSILGPPGVLRKSNAGYDLHHLLLGSEGTLGIVTAAALRMRPAPVAQATALLGVETPAGAIALFVLARQIFGDAISAFELMSHAAADFHFSHAGGARDCPDAPWLVLIECESTSRYFDLPAAFDALLERATKAGSVTDGRVAASLTQSRAFWTIREGIAIAMGAAKYPIVKTDTAVPVAAVPDFVAGVEREALALIPECRLIFFGHVGDGNIHVNVLPPATMSHDAFRTIAPEIYRMVEDTALALGGTVSAEHGIGQTKREALLRMKSPAEMSLMQAIKIVFDPLGTLNPGKIFES